MFKTSNTFAPTNFMIDTVSTAVPHLTMYNVITRELDLLAVAKTVGDISGEVVELGSGVTNFKPGDKIISISFAVIFSLPIPFTTSLQRCCDIRHRAVRNKLTISGGRLEAG